MQMKKIPQTPCPATQTRGLRPFSVKRVVLTGGPGSGKSSLIAALAEQGFMICEEVSRAIIQQEAKKPNGVLPWTDMRGFADLCQEQMHQDWHRFVNHPHYVFYDRGTLDILAYLGLSHIQPSEHLLDQIAGQRYHSLVFWCPPWSNIYVNDPERPQTFPEAKALGLEIKNTYEKYQYQVLSLPKVSIQERVKFILCNLEHPITE